MQPTMAVVAPVLLGIAAFVVVRHLLVRLLWGPITQPDHNQEKCRAGGNRVSSDGHSPSGIVRVIRLTDDGEFADRCELTDVLYEIRNPKKSELVVWYIHGWKHNAGDRDADLRAFRLLVDALENQQRELGENRRHVVGIYIGWDGAVGPWFLRSLTFWNRKRAADRISQSAVLTRIFASTKFARMEAGNDITSRDLTIMIGHSFGARILYNATCQVLLDEVQRRHPGRRKASYAEIKGQVDLIMLLNPAFEASMFSAMHAIRRTQWSEAIGLEQKPLLLAISTNNDRATGWAFPVGQYLEFATRKRQCVTLGNYDDYVTHTLNAVSEPDSASPDGFWFDRFTASGLQLKQKEDCKQPGNPFIVARTTPDIIDGHSKIWTEPLRNWVICFLRRLQDPAVVSAIPSGRSSFLSP
ncbi:MAG TPA: hypothetical protein VFU28_10760 [Vicinamibacterales bacterium]|nr:hypothetical protein [Vicinamibacterales bacterium]